MKPILKLVFFSSIISVLIIAGAAQTPTKPAQPGTIIDNPQAVPIESWQEFKHEAGNLSVMMPGKPSEASEMVESAIGKIPTHTFTTQRGTFIYLAMYAEYPIAIDAPRMVKNALDNARDGVLGDINGKAISETDISFGKYAGRELKAKVDGGLMRSRTYIVNQRMYMLIVSVEGGDDPKQLDSKNADDFFGSFKLLKEPLHAEGSARTMSQVQSEIDNLNFPPDLAARPVFWREVPSPEFGFTVWMPSEPFRKKFPLNPNDGRLDINLWVARSENSLYQMMVQPLLAEPKSDSDRNALFRSFLDGLLSGGKIQSEGAKPISFGAYPGREYKLRAGSSLGTGRMYIIGGGIYFLLAMPDKKPVESKEISEEFARFFDSFKLTKEPDAVPTVGTTTTLWREIIETEHGFKVLMPGEPDKDSSNSEGISNYSWASAGDGIVCVVTHQQLPPPESQYESESFYKTFIDSYAQSGGFEIAGAANVVLEGREGREYKLKKNDKTGVIRVFLTGLEVHSVMAIAVSPEASATSVPKLLDSFKLIKKSP